ncbi:hypothetical protein BLNAU_4310 [Blattamonas nauphoetae]|uniref:Uncharacterized protein n=1 Tax=Blattamonas nauphoetae TaxID=2049346 RepID=A0ABQ9YA84_9EUKA|nr:hypothetical protein BLNAU_4310 [Blattamonas nauphoetae]
MISFILWINSYIVGDPSFELNDLGFFLAQQDFHTAANSEQTTRTIRLSRTDFASNTVRFKDQNIGIDGKELILTRIFEGQQARESLISASNSTITLNSLSLETISTRALIITGASVCHLSDSHVLVLKHLSPMEINASSLIVDSTRFSFPQSTSPSLCTTDSTSSTVLFRQCSFLDVVVESGGSFLTCPKLQQLDVASTRFSNISHCPTYFGADPHVPSFNVSLHDSQFDRCENVLDGGVIRNVNTRTTLFASNTTFTLSQTTYTLVTDAQYEEKQITEITTNHNYTSCSFTKCTSQTHGGALRCRNGASLAVHSCTFVDNNLTRNPDELTKGGAIYFEGQSTGGLTIVVSSFLRCTGFFGGAISCENAGSIHIEQGNITEGKCIKYTDDASSFGGGLQVALIPSGSIVKNVRLERCSTERTGGSLDNSQMQGTAGVDIRFSWNVYWKTCLIDPTSFINCFSTSVGSRILYEEPGGTPKYTTFEFLSPPNSTNMNVLLPDPQVIVNIETGRDEDKCGASYDFKCKTLNFVGEHMIPMKDGVILVEAGRYEESTTIALDAKSTTFSSFGTDDPIMVYSGETPFITKTIGAFTIHLFTFLPKSGRMLLSQTDAGSTTVSDCVIRLNGEASTPISEPLFKTTAGTLTFKGMILTGLVFSGGCCVSCSGSTTTLDVQDSSFIGLGGQSEPCLNFKRDSTGGTLTLSQIEIEGTAGSLIGGITTSNVQSVSVSVTTFSRLLSTTQKAPLSITSCGTLTLSGLLFENCAGQSASSLFVDSSSTVSLDTPIASSFSISSITIDSEDGTDQQFCWSTSVGCQSLSGIVDRLMPIHEYNLNVAEGTTSESTLSITSKKTITVTGLGSARSLIVMKSTTQSFADLTAGSLSLATLGFTESSSQTGVSRQKSFFDVKGGSLRLESVEFVPLSFSGTSSFVKMSGAWILSLKSVFISRESFSSGDVVMKSVSISTAGMTGSHEVFLEGQNVGSVVDSDWTSLIGLNNEMLTKAKLEQVFGSDTKNTTNIGPLGYHLYPHASGAMFVSEGFWDHGKCGEEHLPCSTLSFGFSLLTNTKTILSLSSDITLSTSLSSPTTGASISSSSSSPKSLIFDSNGQFVVESGQLSFLSIGLTLPSSLTQPLFVVKGSSLTLSGSVTIMNPPSAAHSASLFRVEGGKLILSGTVFDFAVRFSSSSAFLTQTGGSLVLDTVSLSSLTLASASVIRMEGASTLSVTDGEFKTITQTGSGGGAFLSTNGKNDQIVTIRGRKFESVSSVGDGGVILAQLGTRSKLTVSSTTFTLCSSSGKGGALSIVLSSTGSYVLQAGTSFSSCTATNGNALFVQAPTLSSVVTRTSMVFLGSTPITPTTALLNLYRGWNTPNTTDFVPLILFFATIGSDGFASSSGSDGELCGFSVYPCSSLTTVQRTLVSYGTETEGKLNPITLELQTPLDHSTSFSCGTHEATITGNTITLSNTGQFTTASSSSSLTLSALTILFASTQTKPVISLSLGKVVVSGCTIGNEEADIPVTFGSVSGGSLEMRGTNSMKLISPSSPLFIVTSGTLTIESRTTLTHSATKRTSSLFSLSGGSTTVASLAVPSLALDSASSVFSVTKTAALSLSSMAFSSITNDGSGSVIHSTTTGTLSLSSVSFTSCNCGVDGKGRSVFISRPSFSSGDVVMKSVSIQNAGTTGSHEVYVDGEDVGALVTTDWTSLIGTNDNVLTKAKLEEVFGSDSTNTTNCGPLGYHLYPHASGAMFVSEGFWGHGKCGQERLPCSTLQFAFSLLTNTKTILSLSSDITLSTSLSSPTTGASISSSSSSPKSLLFESDGQLVVEAGSLALSSMGLALPSSLTQPLLVVKERTLTLSDSVTITNPSSTKHSASLFKIEGGTLTLSGTVFDFTVHFSSSSTLLTQTGGNLELDTVTFGNVSRSDGDGSIVHSSLSSSDKLEIVGCSFSSCSSSGNGGALFISSSLDHNSANLIIQSTFGSDISCGKGKKGEWVFLRGDLFESYLTDSTWTGSISSIVAPTDDALLWGEDGSEKEESEYASLSLLYYLKVYNQPIIAVGDGGRDGGGCGRTHLRCSSLSTAISHLSGSSPFEVEIVSSLSLETKETFSLSFTMKPSGPTATITVGKSGAFEVSANTLTLSTLTFDGKGTERSNSLLSIVNMGSITIAGCTFANLKTSGKGSVFSSTLNTGNTLSLSESSFSSCSSAGNGGVLFVEVNGGSFEISATLTFTGCSSKGKGQNLFLVHPSLQSFLSGGSLDGIKPTLPSTGLVSKVEKEKWFGSTSTIGESSSLLYFWHPHTESSGAVHVHENGESHSLCGLRQLPCSLVQSSLSKANTDHTTIIDSAFVLNEGITTANSPSTLTSVSKSVTVSVGMEGKFALSSGSLTLSKLSFVQLSSLELLDHALISVDYALSSLTVDNCSFKSFSLSVSALIEHSCSSLTLKSSVFTDIVRLEGDGGVLKSVMVEGMELDVDSVELASVWTQAGDGDGFFISFSSISDPSKIPPFSFTNLTYSLTSSSNAESTQIPSFIWLEGKSLSDWIDYKDPRFKNSYDKPGMSDKWLWT